MITEELVGWKAIAEYLGVSTSTARRYKRDNDLPAYKVVGYYRATQEDLREWVANFKR